MSHLQKSKQHIARCFNQAAHRYAQVASVQQSVRDRLWLWLSELPKNFHTITDLGAGIGDVRLRSYYPGAHITLVDIAQRMLHHAQRHHVACDFHYLCGDFDYLPLAHHSIDLIFSNMALQWSLDLPRTLEELKRALNINGYFIFSLPIESTFTELKQCYEALDKPNSVNAFMSENEMASSLRALNFKLQKFEVLTLTRHYPDLLSIFLELKAIGCTHVVKSNQNTLLGKQHWVRLVEQYDKHRDQQNQLPLTYKILLGVARNE